MQVHGLAAKVEIIVASGIAYSTDLVCALLVQSSSSKHFNECGRTERLSNTLRPEFSKALCVDFLFEERQNVKFQLYEGLDAHKFLGEFQSTLGELVSRRRTEAKLNSTLSSKESIIIITCVEVAECKEEVMFHIEGKELANKYLLCECDPCIEIHQPMQDVFSIYDAFRVVHQWNLVYKTEVIQNSLHPKWAPFCVNVSKLCRGNKLLMLRWDCYDYDVNRRYEFIGSFYCSLQELLNQKKPFSKYNSRIIQHKLINIKGDCAGKIEFTDVSVINVDSFIEYIQGGCELHFTVAIDFTASNGDPEKRSSLHFVNADGLPNQYELAITSVGEIVQDYDSDKQFPAFGFGAKLPPSFSQVNHAFALNFNPQNPCCSGISGLLSAYRSSIRSVQLSEPRHFSPIIDHVASCLRNVKVRDKYLVLLMITDGIIEDFADTKKAIIRASKLPMSVIIVGVGDKDFDEMEKFNVSKTQMKSGSLIADRHIVQFVSLRKFMQSSNDLSHSKCALAKEVLAVLPNQFCEWMRKHSIRARHPRTRTDAKAVFDGSQGQSQGAYHAFGAFQGYVSGVPSNTGGYPNMPSNTGVYPSAP